MPNADDPHDPAEDAGGASARIYGLKALIAMGRDVAGDPDLDVFTAVNAAKRVMAGRGYVLETKGALAESADELMPTLTFTFVRS